MNSFVIGLLAGYGIAIPVGAVAILIFQTALTRGFVLGFFAGAGAATADLLYALLAALAGQALSNALAPYGNTLKIVSALVLGGVGIYGLRQATQNTHVGAGVRPAPTMPITSPLVTYAQFLGITLLNPLTIAYFAALILGQQSANALNTAGRVWFVAGAGIASLSWQTFLAVLGHWAGKIFSLRAQRAIGFLGNGIILLLAVQIVCGY